MGLATSNVPAGVYGVIDLYGQAAEASIVQSAGMFIHAAATCHQLSYIPTPTPM